MLYQQSEYFAYHITTVSLFFFFMASIPQPNSAHAAEPPAQRDNEHSKANWIARPISC
jgi:hypothetical protein